MSEDFFEISEYIEEDKDFIAQVANFISEFTKTSYNWAECVATSMISTAMGSERYITNIIGKLPLNVWYLCIGPSGIAKKTVPLKNYLVPIMIGLGEDEKFVLPNRFSVEGYIKFLSKNNSQGIMIRDEFTGLLKESKSKDYIADLLEFLSELYDGSIQKRATMGHGVNQVKKCYVVFASATTPYLYKVMKPEFFTQGTGNRILIELFDTETISEDGYNPEEFSRGRVYDDQRESFIKDLISILNRIRQCKTKMLVLDDESAVEWTNFEKECRVAVKGIYRKNVYDLNAPYLSRSAEMALKLAGIYAISRRWNQVLINSEEEILVIEKEDMIRGIKRSKHHFVQFSKMLKKWRARPESRTPSTLDEQADAVLGELRQANGGLNWSELRTVLKWDDYAWRNVLKQLHDTDKIKVTFGDSTKKGGRRPTIFYENTEGVEIDGKAIGDWAVIQQKLRL